MQDSPSTFSFKENIVARCFISLFFGLAAAMIMVAALLKLKDGPTWWVLALGGGLLTLALLYYTWVAIWTRQVVSVTPEVLTSHSRAYGTRQMAWRDITDIREVQTRIEKVRSAAPLVEVMLSLYLNLPFLAGIERRANLVFEAGPDRVIALREHLIYPHRLDQLRQAIGRYAPPRSKAVPIELILKANTHN